MIPPFKFSPSNLPDNIIKIICVVALLGVVLSITGAITSHSSFLKTKKLTKEREVLQEKIDKNIEVYKRDSTIIEMYKDSLYIYREKTLRLIESYDNIEKTFIPERIAIDSSDVLTDYSAVSEFITEDPYRMGE